MKKLMIIVSAAVLSACGGAQQKSSVPAIDTTNLDRSVALNEDFYQFATGGWQKKNPLKPEYSRYGAFDVLAENNEKRINELFQSMNDSKPAAGSVEQKITDIYKLGMDSVRLNNEGAAPIAETVKGTSIN